MSKNKLKPLLMPKVKDSPMLIKVDKVSTGLTHLAAHRCGAHDNRQKRLRTRAAQKAAAIKEF